MTLNKPKQGDVVYEYVPQNLNSSRNYWIEHKWQELEYFKMRWNAGLIYSNLKELEFRVKFDKQMHHQTMYNMHSKNLSKLVDECLYIGQKKFEQQYMCDWKKDAT